MKPDRPLPRNDAAEAALIGCALLHGAEVVRAVGDVIESGDFYDPRNRVTWAALQALTASDAAIDPIAVEAQIKRDGAGGLVSDLARLGDLVAVACLRDLARSAAAHVRDAALLRAAILGARDVAQMAYAERETPADLARRLAATAQTLAARAGTDGITLADLARAVIDDAANAEQGRRPTLRCALAPVVDDLIPSLAPGEMLVIGGRPSSGKSHLAGDLAWSYALSGAPGLVLTLEDSAATWIRREIAKVAGLDAEDLRRGALDVRGWTAAHEAAAAVSRLPVSVEWVGGKRAYDLAARIAVHAQRRAIQWAVVDYVQLCRASQWRGTREESTSATVDELKAASGASGVTLILCSQLRRLTGEGEGEVRPNASDLRNSGMLEAQADAVLLLWRHRRADPHACKLILAKHKHGTAREVDVLWWPHRRDYAPDLGAPVRATGRKDWHDDRD